MTRLSGCPGWPEDVAARYRALGLWTGETFGTWLRDRAWLHADREAVVGGGARWTYTELDARADAVAAGFRNRLGLRAGDRVIVQLPNAPAYVEVVLGLLRLGALPVFALPAHRRAELTAFAAQSEAAALVTCGALAGCDHRLLAEEVRGAAPTVRDVVVAGAEPLDGQHALDAVRASGAGPVDAGVEAAAVAFLQLSGGSTGIPKLIPRTHDDYLLSVRRSAEVCRLSPRTRYLAVLPAAHNFTMSSPGILGVLHAGGTVVLSPSPAPDTAFALLEQERITHTALVPPLAIGWLEAAPHATEDLSSLEVLQVGGAKLDRHVAARVAPVLGCRLQQVFGMAEGLVNYTRDDDPDELVLTTQGRPMSDQDEVRVVDDADRDVPDGTTGHLLTRGPYTIRGYFRAPEHDARAFTADGFYRTGDVVRRLRSGHLVVEGRAKDQINRGGEKIAPDEVESHLLAHPAVVDAAVVGVPDPRLGERSCAFVVPRGDAPRPAELRRFIRERGLAAFKVPDRIEVVPAFPQTGVGKVSRRELRTLLARSLQPDRHPTPTPGG